ncbi:M23 family metallopeptidase [Flavobacterium sp.]|uniref:M23 family metallopeptidase n=1 Tax=Flavobacterium sp. TaxID=239 RepID=UPI0025E071F9|nr:M23 family metallopeptidase [Flavobacterium sp.]
MKSIIFVLLLTFTIPCFSQIKKNLYHEKTANGYKVLADNDEFCPISMLIDFKLTNLSSSNGNHKIFVVPAKTKGFVITTLEQVKPNSGGGFTTKSKVNYGDSTITNPIDYNYSLPFQKGSSFSIFQGYNGSFSHQNENSLDFTMPVGTSILAARDGIVVKVVENNNQNCGVRSCAAFNNYILLYHNDGTFSQYVHLKQNGAAVEEGDVVKENDLIGYSGNIGWSNGPHLHFMVFIQRIDKPETLKTKFKINDGTESVILKEKTTYTRNY